MMEYKDYMNQIQQRLNTMSEEEKINGFIKMPEFLIKVYVKKC